MKRSLLLPFFIAVNLSIAVSQDVINPYLEYTTGNSYPTIPFTLGANNYSFDYYFNDYIFASPYYYGEYEIGLEHHFWTKQWDFLQYSKTYNYEIISFPFMKDCAFTINGCIQPPPSNTHSRELYLPSPATSTYDAVNNYWDVNGYTLKLYRCTPLKPFIGKYSSGSSGGAVANALVSSAFYGWIISDRQIIPHTIVKCTINIMCGTSVISSHSFIYDNTRGRMRFYPFYDDNSGSSSGNPKFHDVIFMPKLVLHPFLNHYYDDDNTPSNIIMPNGVINYYPVADAIITNGCNAYVSPLPGDMFRKILPVIEYWNIVPSSYTVFSTSLRSNLGEFLAGYELVNGQMSTLPGLKNSFNIDQNIDLNIINPTDKVIYNPSETNITADNLIFPSYYTFKTIRGVYPSEADAVTDNTPGNGGPYTDLRDVPVTTDLSSENASDPANDPVYASRYYLKDGSKLTIQSCARLFDVAFDVEQGSTMIIEDYSQMIGQEDKSTNQGRYKIRGLGGAVLRNTASVQYVQNGNIAQPYPLYYTATDKIIAGAEVDSDLDAITGDYVLQPGSEVTFHANNIIRLKPGFRAKSGSRFTARCDNNVAQFPICISSNRFMSQGAIHENNQSLSGTPVLQLFPNPTAGVLNFARENGEARPGKVEVFDGRGKLILEQIYSVSPLPQLDLSQQPDGIYLVKVTQGNDSRSAKVVLNRK